MRVIRDGDALRRLVLSAIAAVTVSSTNYAASAATPPTTQEPASAQPTLPRPMPDLTVPLNHLDVVTRRIGRAPNARVAHRHAHQRSHAATHRDASIERPALAAVDLTERLPYPPQPPHIAVPTPAYPLENFVVAFTTPPPPIVCRPTHRNRFQPDPEPTHRTAVLCTADNP